MDAEKAQYKRGRPDPLSDLEALNPKTLNPKTLNPETLKP